jgi:hypothetical protein
MAALGMAATASLGADHQVGPLGHQVDRLAVKAQDAVSQFACHEVDSSAVSSQ